MDNSISSSYLFLIPLLPLLGAAINLLLAKKVPRFLTHIVAVGSVLGAFCVVLSLVGGPLWAQYQSWQAGDITGQTLGGLHQVLFEWIHVGDMHIDLAFRLDTLTAVMLLVITGIGTLIHIYSMGYMSHEPRYAAYFGYLNLFTGAMLILVLGDSLPVMFIGWEGVGLCSYLLIGFWFEKDANASAGKKAFIVNRVGDFFFIVGMCLLFYTTGTLSFRDFQDPVALAQLREPFYGVGSVGFFACLFLFLGACGKSAQFPLYVWLPDAMAGPTPVSALIHAATMVTAGVYMISRSSALFLNAPQVLAIVASVGAFTALFAAAMAFAQTDLKKVLAYSTVSQLGFMFVGVGTGAFVAGVFHLMTHAFFKAGLFLGAGSVMHAMSNSGDITKMGGLRSKLPFTHFAFLVYCLAIAGIPPLAGFFSKDEILAGAAVAHLEGWPSALGPILWTVLSVAALGTAFYMFRLYFLVFSSHCRADEETRSHIHESPASMTIPLIILAVFAICIGFVGPAPVITALIGLPNTFAAWLAPSLIPTEPHHLSHSKEWGLIAIATLAAIGGILMAWVLYRQGPSSWVRRLVDSGPRKNAYDVVRNKFYVDEAYDAGIVRPLRWFSDRGLFRAVDHFLIDGVFVNGAAFVVGGLGRAVAWFQNGQVQRYLVVLLVGAAGMFFLASRPTAAIVTNPIQDGTIQFVADLGGGLAAEGSSFEWDFNGDGQVDSTSRQATWNFGRAGEYEVTLTTKEPIFGREHEVKTVVVIDKPSKKFGGGQ